MCKMDNIYLLYVDFSRSLPLSFLLSKVRALPSYINTTPIPCPEASHSIVKVLVKFGVANTRMVVMAVFRFLNALFASLLHLKEPFFNKYTKGIVMRVYLLTNLL